MLPINLTAISLIFCLLLKKTHSHLLHVGHYLYVKSYPFMVKCSRAPMDSINWGGEGGVMSKTEVLIPLLPLNCYVTLGKSLNGVSISTSEKACLGYEE